MTKMLEEILEQPDVLIRCAGKNAAVIGEITAAIRSRDIKNIIFAGRGTSDNAAIYGRYLAECLTGIPSSPASPSVMTVYGRTMKLQDSLIIGLSQSGEALDVQAFVDAGTKCGAVTVAITNFEASPVARAAGYILTLESGVEKSVAATKTFTAELYLLALLFSSISGENGLAGKLIKLPDQLREQLTFHGETEELAQRYAGMRECIFLARGVNYAIAAEAALKLQETAYVQARAFPISDYYHGPLAAADKELPFFVFAPDGPTLGDSTAVCKRLFSLGCKITVITNRDETAEYAENVLAIPPEDDDFITPFYNAVAAQLFANASALIRGLDPDRPRNIKKITVTL